MPKTTAVLLLAGLAPLPVAAQMLGPTWETDIVLTKSDFDSMQRTFEGAILGRAVGTVASWQNPDSRHFGTLRLLGEFMRSGLRCERVDYTIAAVTLGLHVDHFVFNVCLQPDGSWKFA